jgi:MFS family permease
VSITERRGSNTSRGEQPGDQGVEEAGASPETISTALPGTYWRQWSASVVSNLGDGINFVAMPLLALSLTDDTRLLALTTFAVFAPWLLIGIPVGVLVDRFDRQRLMIVANVVRVVLFGLVAAGAAGGWLGIPLLIGLLFVIGCCEVVFDSSAQAFLPMLVEPGMLGRANGLLFAAEVVAGSIAGLSIGALLFDVGIALPFAVNAATFAGAALLTASIRVRRSRHHAADPRADPQDSSGLLVGLRWLWNERLLRTLAIMFAVTNLGLMFGQGVFVMYAVDDLGLTEAEFGILLAITAMGAATGGLIGSRVMAKLGLRTAVIVPYLVFGIGSLIISLSRSAWIVAATGFVLGAAITVWNVVTVTVRQRMIPSDRFGRVNAVYRWLGAAASATGIALGGLVAHQWSVRSTYAIGGAITVIAAVVFARPVLAGLAGEREPQSVA